jgi:hypothetical protein
MRIDFSHLFEGAVAIWGLGKIGARRGVRVASSALLLAAFLTAQSPAHAEGLNTGFDANHWKKVRAAKGIPEPGTHQESKAAEGNPGTPASTPGGAASAASSTPAVSAASPEVCSALEKEMTKMSCRFSETCGKLMGKCSEEQLQCKDSKCLAVLKKKNKGKSNSKKDGKKDGSSNEASSEQDEQVATTGTENSCDETCQQKLEAEKLAKAREPKETHADGHASGAAHSNTHTTDPHGHCVEEVKSGKVAYDQSGSSSWNPDNIERLCKGVTDASQRIGCFRGKISSGIGWSVAIDECVSGISHAPAPSQPNQPANSQSFTHDDASTPTAPSPIQEKSAQITTALERPGVREKVLASPSIVTKTANQEVAAQQLPPSYASLPASQPEIKAQPIAPSYTLAPSTASAPVVQQISVSTQPPVVSAAVQAAAQQAARQIAQTSPSVPTISAPANIPSSKLNAKIPSGLNKPQRISASGTPPSGWGHSACYSNSSSGARVVCWYDTRISGANCPVEQGYRPDAYNGGCYAPALDSVPTSTRCTSKNTQQPNNSFCSDVPR